MPSRIFVDSEISWQVGGQIHLSKEQQHHLLKVLRLKIGAPIEVVNKLSKQVFQAIIITENPATAELQKDLSKNSNDKGITLIFGSCKGDKNEIVIEKCTELGVNKIILFESQHSIGKINLDKSERLQKIAEAAACQSKRNSIPEVVFAKNLSSLTKLIQEEQAKDLTKFICSLEANTKEISELQLSTDSILAVGPEGDFSQEEYAFFHSHNFQPVSLGENTLRAETAAIAAVAYLSLS